MFLQDARGGDGRIRSALMLVRPLCDNRRLAGADPKIRSALRSRKRGEWLYRDVVACAVRLPAHVPAGPSQLVVLVRQRRKTRSERGGPEGSRLTCEAARKKNGGEGSAATISRPRAAAVSRPAMRAATAAAAPDNALASVRASRACAPACARFSMHRCHFAWVRASRAFLHA
jgi:hypothetical protein